MSRRNGDRQKLVDEKLQALLSNLLKEEDNKYCVDCDAKGPRWASWNLGIFLCIRCAGIHRNLGVHLSRVKSVNLDSWTLEQVAMMQEIGNSRARAVYEAHIPDGFRRPQTDSALEHFIRSKYESKRYIAKEWTPPIPSLTLDQLLGEGKKKKPKSASSMKLPPSTESPSKKSSRASQPAVSSQSARPEAAAPKEKPAAASTDLLGLDTPVVPAAPSAALPVPAAGGDLLGDLLSPGPAPAVPTTSAAPTSSAQNDLFGFSAEPAAGTQGAEQGKSAKDSIMALYGGSTSSQTQQPNSWNAMSGMIPGAQSGMMPGIQPGMRPPVQPGFDGYQQMPMSGFQASTQQPMPGYQGNPAMPNSGGMQMGYNNAQHQKQMQSAQQQMAAMGLQTGNPGNPGTGHTLSNSLWQ